MADEPISNLTRWCQDEAIRLREEIARMENGNWRSQAYRHGEWVDTTAETLASYKQKLRELEPLIVLPRQTYQTQVT